MIEAIDGTPLHSSIASVLATTTDREPRYQQPAWMKPYTDGTRNGFAQSMLAYSDYFSVDGTADTDPEVEERISVSRRPMRPFASRTGTKVNLEAMRQNGWGLLVSAKGVLRTEGFKTFMLDNGAWSAFTQGVPFDEDAFAKAYDLLGENASMIVVPDIVAGGLQSLDFSLRWLDRMKGCPSMLLLAVQDGMIPDDVREYLNPTIGILVGGSTSWKLKSCHSWGLLARRRRCHMHVARVNSAKRILLCSAAAGAHSVDGTSASIYSQTCAPLSEAVRYGESQLDFLSPNGQDFDDTPYDCNWPTDL